MHLLSSVSHPDLRALYAGARAFALVSLYEGFGLPFLEAMACGCPVIGSSTTSCGEVIGDGGLQVDPESVDEIAAALDEIVLNPLRRSEIVAGGNARLSHFSWESAARATLSVYRRAVDHSR